MISKALVVGTYHQKLVEMAGLGIDLTVVVPPVWGRQRLENVCPSTYHMIVLPAWLHGRNHVHFYPRLSAVFARDAYDVVHIDEEHYSLVTWQAAHLARRHQMPFLFFTWQNIYKTYPPPFRWMESNVLQHAAGGVAGNAEAQDILRHKGFTNRAAVIPQFGVDPERFTKMSGMMARTQWGIAPDQKVVGFAGRLVEEKGIEDLLAAVARLPRTDVTVVLIGSGPHEPAIRRALPRLGLAGRVVFAGAIPSESMPAALNALDCLVLPSLTRPNWKEQFGRVLIEAMACEVPVIGSSSGEIPQVIGDAGWVFPERDVLQLASMLQRLWSDASLAQELSARGRKRVLERFTQRHIAAATQQFYQQILEP